jgi:acetyl esterase/lipase
MSRNEIVDAFLHGRIDRREFVRRLTVAGVSAGAAVAYAQALSSPASAAPMSRGRHGLVASFQDYPVLDTDGDGLSDDEELTYGTNATLFDTDDDGLSDGEEVDCGSDPLDPDSVCGSNESGGVTPPLAFPSTGVGGVSGGNGWTMPLAAIGAGAAVLGRRLLRSQHRSG